MGPPPSPWSGQPSTVLAVTTEIVGGPVSTTEAGSEFEAEVQNLLEMMGYSVTRDHLLSGTQTDLVAEYSGDRFGRHRVIVECTLKRVGVDAAKEKAAILLAPPQDGFSYSLLYVGRQGFTKEAKAFADKLPTLALRTPEQLEADLIDFGPYARWYTRAYEHSEGMFAEGRLSEHFVDLSARAASGKLKPSATNYVLNWVEREDSKLLFILGEYGAGKTSLVRNVCYQLLRQKYLDKGEQRITPVLINLRENRSQFRIRAVITDALVNLYGVRLASFAAFERFCSAGRVCLVLDGFDEMAERADRRSLVDCFAQVNLVAQTGIPTIVTCRSNFFRSHREVLDLLREFEVEIAGDSAKPKKVSFKTTADLLHLEKLSPDQIERYVEQRVGPRASEVLSQISAIHDLSDLSTRPVLLDMILTTLPDLEGRANVNSAALYETYTNKWTARDRWRIVMPLTLRQEFCEEIAWCLRSAERKEVTPPLLRTALNVALDEVDVDGIPTEQMHHDIQVCSFLVRSGTDDDFRFAHKSFFEYFVARRLVSLLSAARFNDHAELETLLRATPAAQSRDGTTTKTVLVSFGALDHVYVHHMLMSRFFATERATLRPSGFGPSGVLSDIRKVLQSREASATGQAQGLSEEIATFAMELVENLGLTARGITETCLAQSERRSLWCDVLRLSRAQGPLGAEIGWARQFVLGDAPGTLRTAVAVGLGRLPDGIDLELLEALMLSLESNEWSYVIYELARGSGLPQELWDQLAERDDLRLLDRIICRRAGAGELPEDELGFIGPSVITELLESGDPADLGVALELSQSVPMEPPLRLRLVERALFGDESSEQSKLQAISSLSRLPGNQWRKVEALAHRVGKGAVQKELRSTARQLRDLHSQTLGNRVGRGSRNQAVRDRLWGMLR